MTIRARPRAAKVLARAAALCALATTSILPALAAEVCLPAPGEPALVLDGGVLREAPDGAPIDALTGGSATGLACAPGRAAVAFDADDRSRIAWLARDGSAWALAGETRMRGVPERMIFAGGRLLGVMPLRKETVLFVLPDPAARAVTRELSGEASCLAAIPGSELVAVGVGERLHTFRIENAGTWVVWTFDGAITACDAAGGAAGLLVATGRDLVLVHPDDRALRGRLPERVRVTLGGTITEVAWTGRGDVAAVRLAAPDRVTFVSGRDLETLHTVRLPPGASRLAPVATGWVAWANEDGTLAEARAPDASLAREAGKPRARPPLAPRADREEDASRAPRRAEPVVEAIVIRESEPAPAPASAPEPAPAPEPAQADTPERAREPTEKARPRHSPEPEPEPEPASETPERTLPSPPTAAERPQPRSTPSPAPKPMPAPDMERSRETAETKPDTSPPAPPPKPAPEIAAPPAARPGEPADASIPRDDAARRDAAIEVPAGGLGGALRGRTDLVAEVLVLGPDNILREFRRVRPARAGRGATYLVESLPPGSYRVIPMGAAGLTLSATPPFATLTVSADGAARADFEIRGSLP